MKLSTEVVDSILRTTDGDFVALLLAGYDIADKQGDEIVKAVNSHEDLVRALTECVTILEKLCDGVIYSGPIDAAKDVLAKI